MADNPRNYGRIYHKTAKPRKGAARAFGESADWSDHRGCEALYTNKPLDLLKCLRPGQWAKNLLLLAAPFFAYFETFTDYATRVNNAPRETFIRLGLGVLTFILLSGATYIFNDLVDAKRDAKHPVKKSRPIAARKVSLPAALALFGLTLIGGLSWACYLGGVNSQIELPSCTIEITRSFFWCAVLYVLLQPVYTFAARRVKDLGEMVLALGFVLRAIAGGILAGVMCSTLFLLFVFVAALFVVLCKRRSENFIRNAPQPTAADARVLDIEISIVAALTLATYVIYTLAAPLGNQLIETIPWVLLGIFRFLRLTYGDQRASTPEVALFRDPMMLLCLFGWLATTLLCLLGNVLV